MKTINVTQENKAELKSKYDFVRIHRRSAIFAIPKAHKTGYVYSSLGSTQLTTDENSIQGKLQCIRIEKTFSNVPDGTFSVIN